MLRTPDFPDNFVFVSVQTLIPFAPDFFYMTSVDPPDRSQGHTLQWH